MKLCKEDKKYSSFCTHLFVPPGKHKANKIEVLSLFFSLHFPVLWKPVLHHDVPKACAKRRGGGSATSKPHAFQRVCPCTFSNLTPTMICHDFSAWKFIGTFWGLQGPVFKPQKRNNMGSLKSMVSLTTLSGPGNADRTEACTVYDTLFYKHMNE